MNKLFNQAWKYFAGGATILGYQAYWERLQNPERTLQLKQNINSNFETIKTKISDLENEISSAIGLETKKELIEKFNELKNQLNNMEMINKGYFKKFEEGNVSTDSETSSNLYTNYKNDIDQVFGNAKNKATEISDLLSKTKDKFMEDNPIFNVINEFKEYLASLSTMEICLVINITSCVFIITCIISILFAISGNYLIEKYSLEKKLPKISKVIQLRVKFQRYYIFINTFFIILAILSLLFINIITLINS